MTSIKNIKEMTEPLKEEILNGHVHTIDEMKAWLQSFSNSGYNPKQLLIYDVRNS